MDEDSDNDNNDDANVRDSRDGKSTLFCCLSCGIPFAYPDDAYISKNKEVKELIYFTHFIKDCMRMDDRSRASITQWNVNQAHYIHMSDSPSMPADCWFHCFPRFQFEDIDIKSSYKNRFMHSNVLKRLNEDERKPPPKSWENQAAFVEVH